MNAMILAAGLGTRLRPLTDTRPKALVEVGGRTLLEIQIEKLRSAGAAEIVVNAHHFSNQIIDYISSREWGVPLKISDESGLLLETGGGLRKAWPLFARSECPVLVHNVDILSNACLSSLYDQVSERRGNAAALLVSRRDTSRYLLFDDGMRLVGWTNVKTGEVRTPYENLDVGSCRRYAFSGIHALSPILRPLMAAWPERFPIIDFYLSVCGDVRIAGFLQEDLHLLDVGKTAALDEAGRFLRSMCCPPGMYPCPD